MASLRFLISDLDGTLVGHAPAGQRFAAWFAARRSNFLLAYATGRSYESVQLLVEEGEAPRPDFVIGAIGTEIIEFATRTKANYWDRIDSSGWDASLVRRVALAFPELALQPEEFLSPLKVSFFADSAPAELFVELKAAFEQANLQVEITYSCARYLDILPAGINKGTAARRLAEALQVPPDSIVVAGDSGNDLPLFQQGFYGVVVANAQSELAELSGERVYRSRQAYADGVVDGLDHWQRLLTPARGR